LTVAVLTIRPVIWMATGPALFISWIEGIGKEAERISECQEGDAARGCRAELS
jgi:hypothetical protein